MLYREATHDNIKILVEYINRASDGMLEILFNGNSGNMTVSQILKYGLDEENGRDSYKNVIVAEDNDNIIGMIQYYDSKYHHLDDSMKTFLAEDKVKLFSEFYETRIEKSIVINAMYVDEKYRKQGIGTNLISLSKDRAKSLDLNILSLYVYSDNITAQSFYFANGFTISKQIKLNRESEIYLMSCNI